MDDKTETTVNKQDSPPTEMNALSNLSKEVIIELVPPSGNYEMISIARLFLAKYHAIPSVLFFNGPFDTNKFVHATTIINYIRDELKHDLDIDYINGSYDNQIGEMLITSRVSDLNNGVIIEMIGMSLASGYENPNKYKPDHSDNQFLVLSSMKYYFLPSKRSFVEDLAKRFSKMTLTYIEVPCETSCLQMICRNQYGYYLSSINIKKPLITDLGLHYGKDFIPVHEKVIKTLNAENEKGIVFLHGTPGSGKTHYIRYLIHQVKGKTLIYIPPDMAKEISAPEFLPFLMQYPNSVLIIEDAENIIKDRNESSTPSQAVANLLNLSDGLLGDAMHQQIIATFNCDLTKIDPALLRQGRLIANYEFNKLDLESSKILSEKLGFGTEHVTEPMTLAQIYNQNDKKEGENRETIISNEQK